MAFRWRTRNRRTVASAIAMLGVLAGLAALPVTSSADPNLGELNSQLSQEHAQQQHLESTLGQLSGLISSLTSQISLVQSREAAVRAELASDQAQLASDQAALAREQARLAMLRARLARARTLLTHQLVSSYESDNPDLVSVVLQSSGFKNLLEEVTYLRDAEHQQQSIISITRSAKAAAAAAAKRLAAIEAAERQTTENATLQARALEGMNSLLSSRQSALRQAQSVQQAALSRSRARGSQLQAEISQIEAQQAAAEQAAAERAAEANQGASSSFASGPALGPSGGWAIPYAIVLCESGGQNLPPNSAGASGYYQIMPATWRLFDGTGPAAYLASKAEQDAVASRIWDGGAGASNWVCAGIVGIH
jgi:septal ring factor EnvC (AmiA/AmiB activator)